MRGLIRTRVASTFHVVEDTDDHLVLRANWLNYLGCASMFFFFGGTIIFLIGGAAGYVIGGVFCLVGLAAVVLGLQGTKRHVIFDRPTSEVRFLAFVDVPSRIPFREIEKVTRKRLEFPDRESMDTTVYYRLYLITTKGQEIEICQSRDEEFIIELSERVQEALQMSGV